MDFFQILTKENRGGAVEVFPDFVVGRSKDLMVRGRSFYAIWNKATGLWSTDEYDVQRLVDEELQAYAEEHPEVTNVKYMRSFGSMGWIQFRKFMSQISDNSHQLDENLTFANSEVRKNDYVSRCLPYSLSPGDHSAWDELVDTLYSPEERAKIEWAIGAVVSGDSKKIQKFLVFYGPHGTGKSTILGIIQKMFEGYTEAFEAKALGSSNNAFATEVFRNNPLVAVQHDGDLSQIEDNTKLNSIISHEEMTMNEKYKPSYTSRINAFLFMGTNKPVRISDAKSGIIRRLIDVHPTGNTLAPRHYHALMARIDFEQGAIAQHCLEVYREMGKNYYNGYQPLEMMLQTDIFFNFIEAHFDIFKADDGVTLKRAYTLYREFCEQTGIERPLPQYKVRSELQNYFDHFHDRITVDGQQMRSYYAGFNAKAFKTPLAEDPKTFSLVMDETTSILDLELAEMVAQYAKEDGTPQKRWSDVKTTLSELDTNQLHYVKVPEHHIVIDFDLKDDDGGKSLERNLGEASTWPPTYAELSKSGRGVHLHYYYTGPGLPTELDPNYSDGIEVKVFSGNSSLRRAYSRSNNVPIADISSGLPLKEKPVLSAHTIQSERGLRELVKRNLRKEIHPGTKPSIDFIHRILEEAYLSGMIYDLTDMRATILAFANGSTNQAVQCLRIVQRMKFKSDELVRPDTKPDEPKTPVFFDLEVYSNLFIVCYKPQGEGKQVVRMRNPTPAMIEPLFSMNLVGFNNRRYDNHILYGAWLGFNNEQLYKLSQRIINDKNPGAMFGEAYNISYADIYDFSSKKQGLKKFQIELGLPHKEMDIPWDQPVPDDRIQDVEDYCVNDVTSTEAVFVSRQQDFIARQILAMLSGLSINDTTQKHTAKIIFGNDKNPQRSFVYTDLSQEFPGYKYDMGKSTYRGEEVGEGGLVRAKPGMYTDVALLDVASMHPTSLIRLNAFGEYTQKFAELMEARLAIKRRDFDTAREMLDGRLAQFLSDEDETQDLAFALKIIINIVYGLTSAKFDNPFRDPRNKDNIVAKRGALFMIDLKEFIESRGFIVAHIKTDSVKIPNATPEIIEEVKLFGEKYGYTFEHEATYDKFCLVNDAVYVAKTTIQRETGCQEKWTAVGAQFQHPYVFRGLFDPGRELEFEDLCETKQVTQGAMYLDFMDNGELHEMHFVGRTGRFTPVREGFGGGSLYRVKDEKIYAVSGTKGYKWIESSISHTEIPWGGIDMSFFEKLLEDARKTISKFGDVDQFVS